MLIKKKLAIAVLVIVLLFGGVFTALAGDQTVPNGVSRVGAGQGIRYGLNMVDVDVAVIDTGIDIQHTDLNVVGGHDCTDEWVNLSSASGVVFPHDDFNGHGTHVAGIIGALNDNKGVVGVAPGARLWAVKVLDRNGSGTFEQVICGLNWVRDHADIIEVANMSLGAVGFTDLPSRCTHPGYYKDDIDRRVFTEPMYEQVSTSASGPPDRVLTEFWADYYLHQAICDVVDAGVTVVVAAGNGGLSTDVDRPAAYQETITVSSFADFDGRDGGEAGLNSPCWAQGYDDAFYDYDNFGVHPLVDSFYGQSIDVSAPGVCVLSTYLDDSYLYLTGTSMAAPHAAGAAALYMSENPDALPSEVAGWIQYCAQPQPEGFGDVDDWAEPLLRICTYDFSDSK